MPHYTSVIAVLLICRVACSHPTCDTSSDRDGHCEGDALHLLQRSVGENRVQPARATTTCTALKNAGAYYTSPVVIGSPAQSLNAVIDTGSGPLVIESCTCRDYGFCDAASLCIATEKSATFSAEGSVSSTMHYGSGDIKTSIVTDTAQFANIEATMDHAMLLMTEARLDITAPEGIMGLGLPGAIDDVTEGFLHFAKITTFSICFNENFEGSLVVGQSMNTVAKLGQIGQNHWLLNLNGVSVGTDSEVIPLDICNPASKEPGKQTACAAIPDTGTTNILVPTAHYYTLFATLCDQWERCKSDQPNDADDSVKYTRFTELLRDCGTWIGRDGIDELPSLHFELAGAAGAQKTISLGPWTWVAESNVKEVVPDSSGTPIATGKSVTQCVATFSPVDFNTAESGALWILGLPLFYDYNVGFDLTSNPYSVGFSEEPCSQCGGTDLIKSKEKRMKQKGLALRGVSNFKRQIYIDPSKPL